MRVSNSSHLDTLHVEQHQVSGNQATEAHHKQEVHTGATAEERVVSHTSERHHHHSAPFLHEGSRGGTVRGMQHQLAVLGFRPGPIDGIFGPRTEAALKRFQHTRGLSPNGLFDSKSNAALDRATSIDIPKASLHRGSRGEAVRDLQQALTSRGYNPGAKDGIFGPRTEHALRAFQRSRGISADGIYGPRSRQAFSRGPMSWGGGSSHNHDRHPSVGGHHPTHHSGNGSISYNGHRVSDHTLRAKMERIADYFGRHISVTSGDRDYVPPGGSPTSLHLEHRAVDFHVDGLSDAYVFSKLRHSGLLGRGYEVIRHGPYTATGGPHIHIGRYGYDRPSDFKVEGTSHWNSGVYIHV